MGKDTLQTLAEIKMHVRDEHIAHNEMKTRLKSRFGTVDSSFSQQQAPPSSSPSTRLSDAAQEIPFTDQVAETENGASNGNSIQLLSTIIDQFVQQRELDDDGPEIDIAIANLSAPSNPLIPLEDLFDFSQDYWVEHHQRTSRRSLSDEMEAYSLLDTDLPGEEGLEVAIDDTVGEAQ